MADYPLGTPVPTRVVFARDTGEEVVVDDRTFHPDWHSEQPPSKGRPAKKAPVAESGE